MPYDPAEQIKDYRFFPSQITTLFVSAFFIATTGLDGSVDEVTKIMAALQMYQAQRLLSKLE